MVNLETIILSLFRNSRWSHTVEKQIINRLMKDFLNLDWSGKLEAIAFWCFFSRLGKGDSMRITSWALVLKLLILRGLDTLVWNNRSCGGDDESESPFFIIMVRPMIWTYYRSRPSNESLIEKFSYQE